MLPTLPLPLRSLLALSIDTHGSGKRRVDGSYASTRLKSTVTEGWANERFRQVMLLVREFWVEWPAQSLITNDDVATIRSLVDCALYTATREEHTADVYDLNSTVWAIWFVQLVYALRVGGWVAESAQVQERMSFETLYGWLHGRRGQRRNLLDITGKKVLKRYTLPVKAMTVPPTKENLFKWVRGARRLSDWIAQCQSAAPPEDRPSFLGFPSGLIGQLKPDLVPPPPMAAAAAARREDVWNRVVRRARERHMRTAQEDSADARLTRDVVAAVAGELVDNGSSSGGSGTSPGAAAASTSAVDDSYDSFEEEVERAMFAGSGDSDGEESSGGAEVTSLSDLQRYLMSDGAGVRVRVGTVSCS